MSDEGPSVVEQIASMLRTAGNRFAGTDPQTGESDYWGRGGLAGLFGTPAWYEQSPQDIAMGFAGSTTPKVGGPIRAFHGSPHDFDKFDLSKIGTGEGAQAYGHGLYFAQNEGVARSYRDMLKKYAPNVDGFPILEAHADGSLAGRLADKVGFSRPESIEAANLVAEAGRRGVPVADLAAERAASAAALHGADEGRRLTELGRKLSGIDTLQAPGRMYEVNLHADPASLLDWDKPLAEQGSNIKDAYAAARGLSPQQQRFLDPGRRGESLYKALAERLAPPEEPPSWTTAYNGFGNQAGASQALLDAGIPGIKYLDQGSRSAGEGTSNYVMFNPDLIEILRKYGLAGLATGGAGAASMGSADAGTSP